MNTVQLPPSLPVAPANGVLGTRANRIRGWLLIIIGLGLSVAMVVIAANLYQTIAFPNLPGNHSRWHGSPEFTRMTFELFGTIFLFGLACFGSGTLQAITGRRHWAMVVPILLLVPVIIYLGHWIITSNGPIR